MCARARAFWVCVSVRTCVCVRVCVCVRATFCACVYNLWHLLVPTKREARTVGCFQFDPWTSFYNYMTLGEKKLVKKESANSFYRSNTF